MSKDTSKDEVNIKTLIFVSGASIIVLWLLTLGLTVWLIDSQTARGTFGDMFGSVNALFSGLAFAGVIITILLQKAE